MKLTRLRPLLEDLRTAARMPRVDVVLSHGKPGEEESLRDYRSPHPRYRIVGRKVVGVALLPLDEFSDVEGYLVNLRYARRRVRRAARLGYTVGLFDPNERRSELHAIHTSMPERQGREIDSEYLDSDVTYETGAEFDYVGVIRDGELVAYCQVLYEGEIAGLNRIMGHGEHLAAGIMFLLVAGVVEHVKNVRPATTYIFYDMFFGAGEGLRAFKVHTGFRPYYVRWRREVNQADGST